jgi:hypothetical protein
MLERSASSETAAASQTRKLHLVSELSLVQDELIGICGLYQGTSRLRKDKLLSASSSHDIGVIRLSEQDDEVDRLCRSDAEFLFM